MDGKAEKYDRDNRLKQNMSAKAIIIRFFEFTFLVFVFLCCGCTTPTDFAAQELHRYDPNTTYRIDDHPDGFTVTVYYSRYQFVLESDVVAMAGKSALFNIIHDIAQQRGRSIASINEQLLKMSTGRNGLSGMTLWTGNLRVFYVAHNLDPDENTPSKHQST